MKVFITCPAYIVTGGIELVHQFSYKLNLLGFDSYVFYTGYQEGRSPLAPVYQKYNVKWVTSIDDSPENIIVYPEIYFYMATQLVTRAKRVIWWMSVDNAHGEPEYFQNTWNDKEIYHLSQSQYSTDFLLKNGVSEDKILWLSDYINSEYLHLEDIPTNKKDLSVLFNPRKGFEKTAQIIANSSGHVKWIALKNLSPTEMRSVMQHSRVYIDFGNHPGKDRIPREAVMCGCLVITNTRGAAGNDIDVLINKNYKFDDDTNASDIFTTITELLANYDSEKKNYLKYRERTANEFKAFEVDALSAISTISAHSVIKKSKDELKATMLDGLYTQDYQRAFRALVEYRYFNYNEDIEFNIIEACIRTELNELYEAEFILHEAQKSNPNNYEIFLELAHVHSLLNSKEDLIKSINESQQAIELSKGTPDESIVIEQALQYMKVVEEKLNENPIL